MERQANHTVFNAAQLYILELMARVRNENELNEIKDVLARHFADKALDAVDRLWDEGTINDSVVQAWKNEHMRTPYRTV